MKCPLIVATLFLVALPATATEASPSFDCSKAGTATEHAICASEVLSGLDREIAASYAAARDGLKKKGRQRLKKRQLSWIERRDACGSDAACIERLMRRRLARLQGRDAPPPPDTAATDGGLSGTYCARDGADVLLLEERGNAVDFSVVSFQGGGHSCGTGRLRAAPAGAGYSVSSEGCTFTLTPQEDALVLAAEPFDACRFFCGARAALDEHVFRRDQRRPLASGWTTAMESDGCS